MFGSSTVFVLNPYTTVHLSREAQSALYPLSFFSFSFWYSYYLPISDEKTIGETFRVAALETSSPSVRSTMIKYIARQLVYQPSYILYIYKLVISYIVNI